MSKLTLNWRIKAIIFFQVLFGMFMVVADEIFTAKSSADSGYSYPNPFDWINHYYITIRVYPAWEIAFFVIAISNIFSLWAALDWKQSDS